MKYAVKTCDIRPQIWIETIERNKEYKNYQRILKPLKVTVYAAKYAICTLMKNMWNMPRLHIHIKPTCIIYINGSFEFNCINISKAMQLCQANKKSGHMRYQFYATGNLMKKQLNYFWQLICNKDEFLSIGICMPVVTIIITIRVRQYFLYSSSSPYIAIPRTT